MTRSEFVDLLKSINQSLNFHEIANSCYRHVEDIPIGYYSDRLKEIMAVQLKNTKTLSKTFIKSLADQIITERRLALNECIKCGVNTDGYLCDNCLKK